MNFKNAITLFIIVGIAVALRLLYIDRPAFWDDEAFLILVAKRISFTSPLPLWPEGYPEGLFADHPPLFIWMLSPFARAFGSNELILRLPSVFFGACTVVVMYFFGRLLANQLVGNLSSLLLALLPFHIVYSQQATNYSALLFFFVSSLYLFSRGVLKSERRTLYASAAMTTLALFTHYLAILIYPIQFASLILSDKKKMIYDRHVWMSWITGIIPFFFWIFFAPRSLGWQKAVATKTPLVYYFTVVGDLFSYPLALMTVFYCIPFKKPWEMTFQKSLIISWLVVSFSFLFFGLQIYDERYAFPVIPAVLLSGALFLSKINSSVKVDTKIKFLSEKAILKPFLITLLIVSITLSTTPNYVYLARNQMWWMKTNWRDSSHYLSVNYMEGDVIVCYSPASSAAIFPVRLYTGLEVERIRNVMDFITDLQTNSDLGRVWFLVEKEERLDDRFLTFLIEECFLKYVAPNGKVKVYLFQKP